MTEMTEMELLLQGYRLTTAKFFYYMPDYLNVIASPLTWQFYDLAPDYPKLFAFIEFWKRETEGQLHSVQFTHPKPIAPGEWRNVVGELRYH